MLRIGWGMERTLNGGSGITTALALPVLMGHFGQRGSGFFTQLALAMRSIPARFFVVQPFPAVCLAAESAQAQAVRDDEYAGTSHSSASDEWV